MIGDVCERQNRLAAAKKYYSYAMNCLEKHQRKYGTSEDISFICFLCDKISSIYSERKAANIIISIIKFIMSLKFDNNDINCLLSLYIRLLDFSEDIINSRRRKRYIEEAINLSELIQVSNYTVENQLVLIQLYEKAINFSRTNGETEAQSKYRILFDAALATVLTLVEDLSETEKIYDAYIILGETLDLLDERCCEKFYRKALEIATQKHMERDIYIFDYSQNLWGLYMELGMLTIKYEQPSSARDYYRKAINVMKQLSKESQHPVALYYLSLSYAEMAKISEDSKHFYSKALSLLNELCQKYPNANKYSSAKQAVELFLAESIEDD